MLQISATVSLKRVLRAPEEAGVAFRGKCTSCGFWVTGEIPPLVDYKFVVPEDEEVRIKDLHKDHLPECRGNILISEIVFTNFAVKNDPDTRYATRGNLKEPYEI